MNELSCGVVNDLLPSYSEGLTGDETNRLVEEHLSACPACREALASMREDVSKNGMTENEQTEIEFLKKNRRRNRGVLIASIAAALALAAILLSLKFFVIGNKTGEDGILVKLDLDGRELRVTCSAWDENRVISSLEFTEEDGIVDIIARTALKSPFFKDTVSKTYTSDAPIKRVTLNRSTVVAEADEKTEISEDIRRMIRESWARYNALPLKQQHASSASPGYCSVYFNTWREAVELLGFEPWNPFEDNAAFINKNFCGADVPAPDGEIKHASLIFDGGENGEPMYIALDAGYSLNGVRVIYSAEPITRGQFQLVEIVHDGAVILNPASFPYGDADASFVVSGRYIYSTKDISGTQDAETLRFRLNGMYFTVRLISPKDGGGSLDSARETVRAIIEEAIRND